MNNTDTLKDIRKEIDTLDSEILKLLGKRFHLVRKVGKCKKEKGIPCWQEDRVNEILNTRIKQGRALGLNEDLIRGIYKNIIDCAVEEEERIPLKKEID